MIIRLLESAFIAIIIVMMCTEFFYPLLTGTPFFGSFRNVKKEKSDLKVKISESKVKANEIKQTQEEVNSFYEEAKLLKTESDNLI